MRWHVTNIASHMLNPVLTDTVPHSVLRLVEALLNRTVSTSESNSGLRLNIPNPVPQYHPVLSITSDQSLITASILPSCVRISSLN